MARKIRILSSTGQGIGQVSWQMVHRLEAGLVPIRCLKADPEGKEILIVIQHGPKHEHVRITQRVWIRASPNFFDEVRHVVDVIVLSHGLFQRMVHHYWGCSAFVGSYFGTYATIWREYDMEQHCWEEI